MPIGGSSSGEALGPAIVPVTPVVPVKPPLPLRGARDAPRTFKGVYSDVEEFLRSYEALFNKHGLITDHDKCKNILTYCSSKVQDHIRSLDSFCTPLWISLKRDLQENFNADLVDHKYSLKDLAKWKHKWSHHTIKKLTTFRTMKRDYITIAGALKRNGTIDAREYDREFWKGLHRSFRHKLDARLDIKFPDREPKTAWTLEQISTAAQKVVPRDNVYEDLDSHSSSDASTEEDTEEETDLEDSSSSDSSEEEEKKKKKSAKTKRTSSKKDKKADEPPTAAAAERRKEDKEMDDLVKQLTSLNLDDPKYALAYFKAASRSELVRTTFSPPQTKNAPPSAPAVPSYTSRLNAAPAPMLDREAPPHFAAQGPRPPMTCFGCGRTGHGLRFCSEMLKLVDEGILIKNIEGQYTYRDGSRIVRMDGETYAAAARRAIPRANLIVASLEVDHSRGVAPDLEYPSDPDDTSDEALVYGAERTTKTTKEARKKYDRARIPAIDDRPRAKAASTDKEKKLPKVVRIQEPVPIDAPGSAANRGVEDIEMQEAEISETPRRITAPKKSDSAARKKPEPRTSDVAQGTDLDLIIEQLLNTPAPWARMRDILGASKELSARLADFLKLKPRAASDPQTLLAAAVTTPVTRGLLIRLRMTCYGRPVDCIIDTGSELNIVSRDTWKNVLRMPMDRNKSIPVTAANGTKDRLTGLVTDVEFRCGGVSTRANLFVSEDPPFHVLLGRPWQQGNLVSIDERRDGTYLIFKDPITAEPAYELLVHAEGDEPPSNADTWFATTHTRILSAQLDDEARHLLNLVLEPDLVHPPPPDSRADLDAALHGPLPEPQPITRRKKPSRSRQAETREQDTSKAVTVDRLSPEEGDKFFGFLMHEVIGTPRNIEPSRWWSLSDTQVAYLLKATSLLDLSGRFADCGIFIPPSKLPEAFSANTLLVMAPVQSALLSRHKRTPPLPLWRSRDSTPVPSIPGESPALGSPIPTAVDLTEEEPLPALEYLPDDEQLPAVREEDMQELPEVIRLTSVNPLPCRLDTMEEHYLDISLGRRRTLGVNAVILPGPVDTVEHLPRPERYNYSDLRSIRVTDIAIGTYYPICIPETQRQAPLPHLLSSFGYLQKLEYRLQILRYRAIHKAGFKYILLHISPDEFTSIAEALYLSLSTRKPTPHVIDTRLHLHARGHWAYVEFGMQTGLQLTFANEDCIRGDNPLLRRHEHKFLDLVQEFWNGRELIHRPDECLFRLVTDLRTNNFYDKSVSLQDLESIHHYISQGFGDEPGEILPI
jgi:hypothetical protein